MKTTLRPRIRTTDRSTECRTRTADLGVQYGFIIIICLLFMDDIALLARSAKELQEILNVTSLFLNKWHLKVKIKKKLQL